jgi:7-cyano-7-deazaguanine reductase
MIKETRTVNYDYSTVDPTLLEVFENPFPANADGVIHIEAPEFTSLCPKTGLPDFANIVIDYLPDKLCLESKSYKIYLLSYRQHGEFHEGCVTRIFNDLTAAMKPKWIKVEGRFSPRGGISFWPTVSTSDDVTPGGITFLTSDHVENFMKQTDSPDDGSHKGS